MMNLTGRAFTAINLKQYSKRNLFDIKIPMSLKPPRFQGVLRMLIKEPFGSFQIPDYLHWAAPLVYEAFARQELEGIRQPYIYLTTRCGPVTWQKDDEFHVDGFSMNYTQLPDQNYIWCDSYPTQYIQEGITIPDDFRPHLHNINWFFEDWINKFKPGVKEIPVKHLVAFDSYNIHRRPPECRGEERAFVRVSFVPVEICDVMNTHNPLNIKLFTRDGVKEFRDKLTRYQQRSEDVR